MVNSKARRGSVLLAGAMFAVAASTVACAAVLGFERLSEDTPAETGAPEASSDGPTIEAGPTCPPGLGLPAKPGVATGDASAGPGTIIVALRVLDLGIDDTAPPVGLNLDGVCSQDVATSSCATAVKDELWSSYGKDKNDSGLDNAGLSLLGTNSSLGPSFRPAAINARLQQGGFGLVLRISSYNGLSNDDAVEVDFFPALGVLQLVDGGGYDAGALDGGVLTFARTDQWTLDERFELLGSSGSKIRSKVAYVADGRLVAQFDNVTLPISVPDDPKPLDIVLNGLYLSGDLSTNSGAWAISNGVFAGRWKTSQFLDQLRKVYIKDSLGLKDAYLCDPAGRPLYDIVKGAICTARDLRSDQEGATSLPCDAFSTGLRFETYAVDQIGPFSAGPAILPRCLPTDGGVLEGDDCPSAVP